MAEHAQEPYLVNGSTGMCSLRLSTTGRYSVNRDIGLIVDFLTREEAEQARVPEPTLARYFSPPRNVKYPVIRFAPMTHCSEDPPPRMLIPALDNDVTDSLDNREATRNQVPLILAW